MIWADRGAARIEIDDLSLECATWGPSPDQAPTIVMLHEGLGCVALWRDFPKRIADATGFGVLAFSRAGYGQSDFADLPRPLNYMTQEAVAVLPQVLDQIGFRRGILLGHSDGATIAAIHAGSIADHRVRGLILMAPHFFTEEVGLEAISEAKAAYAAGDLKARMTKYHRDPDATFFGWNDAWLNPDFRTWNVADVIDYVRIPVLALQGEDDQYGTLAQIEEVASRCYAPVDTEILQDCRHSPHHDQPDKTLAAISEFTKRLERIEHQVVKVA